MATAEIQEHASGRYVREPRTSAPGHARPRTARRPEIQALRAVAVLLVLVYHLWPAAVPGGFVGVDVFFAISGYLITALLLREVERSGAISLAGFWARRMRRLLPAALLVVAACAVVTVVAVPVNLREQFLGDLRASALYVQNWNLAASSVDYFRAADGPSPAEHFWSLSAEEQFYLVWPLLILLALAFTKGRPLPVRRGWIALAMLALTGLSLAYGLRHTQTDPTAAYFITPTRAWEFGAGGLLALIPAFGVSTPAVRAVLSWAGLVAIGVAAATYDDTTPFPGIAAALPVLGALAVMRAGAPDRAYAPTPLLERRPVQFVGDVSYSIYLWHWPLIVLAPILLGRGLGLGDQVAIFGLTILLAWLTKVAVEDPFRAGPLLAGLRSRWTFAAAAVATALVVGLTVRGTASVEAQIHADEQRTARTLAHPPRCFGAPSMHGCANPALADLVVPTPVEAPRTGNAPCDVVERRPRLTVCAFGAPPAGSRETVAIVGDSHAAHWRAALDPVARRRGWRGLSITYTGCPFSQALPKVDPNPRRRCAAWNRQTLRFLREHPEVTTLFVAQHSGGIVIKPDGVLNFEAKVDGYLGAWRALPRTVRRIVVLRATPKMRGTTLQCVQQALDDGDRPDDRCSVPRREALQGDPAVAAAQRLRGRRVDVVDLTSSLCDARICPPVIGGALVYRDYHHLTPAFARTLSPRLADQLD